MIDIKKTDNNKLAKESTYCPLAWVHSFINQNGNFQLCCTSEEFDNNIKDDDGKPINIAHNYSSAEVMNTKYMKDIRLQMLNGKWPKICGRCKISENLGGVSRRQVEIKNYQNINKEIIEKTTEDGTSKSPIISADYRLGNLCNLQCRMCNPRSTKLWIKEWNDMKEGSEVFSEEVMQSYNEYHWIDSDSLVNDFKDKAPTLSHIHFAGGEPLLVPQMKTVLEACIESGNAKNITLTYNTNMTILPKSVLNLWKEFNGVKILASIDAIGDLNSYIRYPSKWDKIEENLKFIDKHHEEYNIQECMMSVTVQILNILHLDKIYKYLSQFEFIVPIPNLVNLHFPTYFQTAILPTKLKMIAAIKLKHIKDKYQDNIPDHYQYLIENIPQVSNFLNHKNQDPGFEFEKFINFQKKFDSSKNLNITEILPEFKPYFIEETAKRE